MSEVTWAYDGSLEALMILVATCIEEGRFPDSVSIPGECRNLFEAEPSLAVLAPGAGASDAAAGKVLGLSRRLYGAVLRAWMSEEAVEADLLSVAADCAARGELALGDYTRPALSRLAASVRRVSKETNHLEGFARFAPLEDGRFVAWLEPRYNVLPALAPCFLGRFGSSPFALVDRKRDYGLRSVATPQGPSVEPVEGPELLALSVGEEKDEAAVLWRSYFRIVENRTRHNPALQRQLMPVRYWKYLTELQA